MGGIENKYGVEIKIEPLYNEICRYTIPDQYYFESCGVSYGQQIFGRLTLDNYYVIRKKDGENDT